jgi:site-specific recombinase XerC
MDLALDCLRPVAPNQWALHVPLGKLLTERIIPVDDDVRQIVARILTLRSSAPLSHLAKSTSFLLPRGNRVTLYKDLRLALQQAAVRIGDSDHITPHRLRHYAASRTMPRRLRRSDQRPAGCGTGWTHDVQDAA